MQGARVQSLVGELDPTCMPQLRSPRAATKTWRSQINKYLKINNNNNKWRVSARVSFSAGSRVDRVTLHQMRALVLIDEDLTRPPSPQGGSVRSEPQTPCKDSQVRLCQHFLPEAQCSLFSSYCSQKSCPSWGCEMPHMMYRGSWCVLQVQGMWDRGQSLSARGHGSLGTLELLSQPRGLQTPRRVIHGQ